MTARWTQRQGQLQPRDCGAPAPGNCRCS